MTLSALTMITLSPVSTCGAKYGRRLPRRTAATSEARRPRTRPSASTTYQARWISLTFGENVRTKPIFRFRVGGELAVSGWLRAPGDPGPTYQDRACGKSQQAASSGAFWASGRAVPPGPFRRPRLGTLLASGGGTPRRADRLSSLTRQGVLVTLMAWRRLVREPEGRRADGGHDRDDHGLVPLCHLLAAPQRRLRGPGPHRGPGRGLGARLRGGSSAHRLVLLRLLGVDEPVGRDHRTRRRAHDQPGVGPADHRCGRALPSRAPRRELRGARRHVHRR